MTGNTLAFNEAEATAPAMEERRSLRLSRVQVAIVLVSAIVSAVIAVVFAQLSPPVYETTRSIIVYSGANPNDNAVLSSAIEELIKSKGLAAEVRRRGGFEQSIDEIAGMIGTRRSPVSPVVEIVVSSPEKAESEAISAEVVPALTAVFDANQRTVPAAQRIPGPVFQEVFALPLQTTSRFPAWLAGTFGLLFGGLVPYLVFLARNLRKPVLSTAYDVSDAIDLPILLKLPAITGRNANTQDAVAAVISAVERLSLSDPIHRLVIVGPDQSQERATLALALASVVARSFGQSVALIDADLQHASLTEMLGFDSVAGLSEALSGQLPADSALVDIPEDAFPRDLAELRSPEGMVRFLGAGIDRSRSILKMRSGLRRVLESMAGRYVVIISGPQIPGPVPSSQLLGLADATLLVVTENSTRLTDARLAGDAMRLFASGPAGVLVLQK